MTNKILWYYIAPNVQNCKQIVEVLSDHKLIQLCYRNVYMVYDLICHKSWATPLDYLLQHQDSQHSQVSRSDQEDFRVKQGIGHLKHSRQHKTTITVKCSKGQSFICSHEWACAPRTTSWAQRRSWSLQVKINWGFCSGLRLTFRHSSLRAKGQEVVCCDSPHPSQIIQRRLNNSSQNVFDFFQNSSTVS